MYEKIGDIAEVFRTNNNYKDQLMRYFHKIYDVRHDLTYVDQEYKNSDGMKRYKTIVYDKDSGDELGQGSGSSKKKSQQRAAKNALLQLELIGVKDNDDEYYEYNNNINIDDELKKTYTLL